METVSSYLERLARETQQPEAEVIALALRTGLRQMWREHVMDQYLLGKLTREEAVDGVGIDWVDVAERQHQAAMDDVQWGLQGTPSP
jgi:hypothetical protein